MKRISLWCVERKAEGQGCGRHPSPLVQLTTARKRMNDLQKALPLEFMDGLSYTAIIEFAEPLAGRRGLALDR